MLAIRFWSLEQEQEKKPPKNYLIFKNSEEAKQYFLQKEAKETFKRVDLMSYKDEAPFYKKEVSKFLSWLQETGRDKKYYGRYIPYY